MLPTFFLIVGVISTVCLVLAALTWWRLPQTFPEWLRIARVRRQADWQLHQQALASFTAMLAAARQAQQKDTQAPASPHWTPFEENGAWRDLGS